MSEFSMEDLYDEEPDTDLPQHLGETQDVLVAEDTEDDDE